MSDSKPVDSSVAAFVPDLMDRSKVSAHIEGVVFVADPKKLESISPQPRLIILDLEQNVAETTLTKLAQADSRVVGYLRHTNLKGQAQAKKIGLDQVLYRSVFFERLKTGGIYE